MSEMEMKSVNAMIEKIKELPTQLQQRLTDTANGMAMAFEAMKPEEEEADTRTA